MSERGYIDGILSTHFDECSIAAADAARTATYFFEVAQTLPGDMVVRTREISAQPLNQLSDTGPERFKVLPCRVFEVDHELLASPFVELVLSKHHDLEDTPLGLSVIFNKDMILPVATFQPRADGRCSYMQLGDEIEDDNLVVTPNAPRGDYVEQIRQLIKGEVTSDEADLVRALIVSQLDAYSGQIEAAYPAAVCRAAQYSRKEADNVRLKLHVVNEDVIQEVEASFIDADDEGSVTHAHRSFDLLLGQQLRTSQKRVVQKRFFGRPQEVLVSIAEEADTIDLYAMVRGDAALRLATLYPKAGLVMDSEFDKPVDMATLQQLLAVFDTKDWRTRRLQLLEERKSPDPSASINNNLHWTMAKPVTMTELADQLNVRQRLDAYLGSAEAPDQVILTQIVGRLAIQGSSAKRNYAGVLKNRKAGKTVTDVDTDVGLSRQSGMVRVLIKGRPSSLAGFEPATLFDERLSLVTKNNLDPEKAEEISQVITQICTDENMYY